MHDLEFNLPVHNLVHELKTVSNLLQSPNNLWTHMDQQYVVGLGLQFGQLERGLSELHLAIPEDVFELSPWPDGPVPDVSEVMSIGSISLDECGREGVVRVAGGDLVGALIGDILEGYDDFFGLGRISWAVFGYEMQIADGEYEGTQDRGEFFLEEVGEGEGADEAQGFGGDYSGFLGAGGRRSGDAPWETVASEEEGWGACRAAWRAGRSHENERERERERESEMEVLVALYL
ncbi:hypothetical protein J5N97_028953 [Dioscorea zingiberensis]|uniref:Uncharacterized protein n=1 Tax=Dioscorea zingiberensis TaxID=325984 RepID=A0A9D5BZF6_9LILI|nr:hypothetical protein J5N97_028953 [Dioscorea zingiberensis]